MRYFLTLKDSNGTTVSMRTFSWDFTGIGKDVPGKYSSHEEYAASMRAKEMYRDAAHKAGKWPGPVGTSVLAYNA